ncbi:uncharacterized protein LOC131668625 [Phymastichus coffea]|uniref:uncharacterized protein LOC131668625 n=1 Tax=Phymastichus coffea TaxID=108790 RepID=UPI00273C3ADD|nr:uncharacterized protein LOC131668625 [Phymastichus coffea]
MHRNYFISHKFYFFAVGQFLICNTIFNVSAHPGIDNSYKNNLHSYIEKKENLTLTLEDIFPNYIVTSEFCDDDSCKQSYEVANYPYEQITDVFPEVSKRLWEHTETSTFIITNRGREEDEDERTEVLANNASFRMQTSVMEHAPETNVYQVNFSRVPAYGYSDTTKTSKCIEVRQTIMPLKGKSHGREYYITNIKTYSQTLTIIKCFRVGINCGNKSLDPENITFNCKQEYEDAELSSFPVGESISLESHRKIPFKVPKGCTCSMTWL